MFLKPQDQGKEVVLRASLPGRDLQCNSHVKQELSQRGRDLPRSKIRNRQNVGVDHTGPRSLCEPVSVRVLGVRSAFEKSRLPSACWVHLANQLKI